MLGDINSKNTIAIYTYFTKDNKRGTVIRLNILSTISIFKSFVSQYKKLRNKKAVTNAIISTFVIAFFLLTNRTFHLVLNQPVKFDCIFHWQFLGKWFNKSHNNHFSCFFFSNPATHQIIELLF